MVKDLGKDAANLSHTVSLEEINCLDKKTRSLSLTYYSKEGRVLYNDSGESKWSYILPDSTWEILWKAVCK